MRLAVDENIPLDDLWFSDQIEIQRFHGRHIQQKDLAGVDAVLVRSITRVDETLIGELPIQFIGTATAGIDHVDTDFLQRRGISWSAAPGCNAQSVVDYVLSAMARMNLPLSGQRVGIIGCGRVGGRLFARLQAMGNSVIGYDPFLSAREDRPLVDLPQLLANVDLVCLHTPFTSSGLHPTANLINDTNLSLLGAGCALINAGRGGVVNEAALLGRPDLRLALDVWSNEPCINSELLQRAELATPHIAGYSEAGKLRGSLMVLQQLRERLGWPVAVPELSALIAGYELKLPASPGQAILQVYDPAEDDAAFRHLWQESGAAGFDKMRQMYAPRAEISQYAGRSSQLLQCGFSGA